MNKLGPERIAKLKEFIQAVDRVSGGYHGREIEDLVTVLNAYGQGAQVTDGDKRGMVWLMDRLDVWVSWLKGNPEVLSKMGGFVWSGDDDNFLAHLKKILGPVPEDKQHLLDWLEVQRETREGKIPKECEQNKIINQIIGIILDAYANQGREQVTETSDGRDILVRYHCKKCGQVDKIPVPKETVRQIVAEAPAKTASRADIRKRADAFGCLGVVDVVGILRDLGIIIEPEK